MDLQLQPNFDCKFAHYWKNSVIYGKMAVNYEGKIFMEQAPGCLLLVTKDQVYVGDLLAILRPLYNSKLRLLSRSDQKIAYITTIRYNAQVYDQPLLTID